MIREITLTGFRGQERAYTFSEVNKITGRNGAGKTTIREAICLLFTGADSAGNRAPTHLISRGADACEVIIKTDKAVLRRSLTAKKNGSLRLERDGVVSTLTQGQMDSFVGSQDVFLSVFIPGYFLALPRDRKNRVLDEVLPPINPADILCEIFTEKAAPDAVAGLVTLSSRYDVSSKPADIIRKNVASERRSVQREADVNEGAMRSLGRMTDPGPEPAEPAAAMQRYRYLESLRGEWQRYDSELRAYTARRDTRFMIEQERQRKVEEREAVKSEIEKLKKVPLIGTEEAKDFSSERARLESELLPLPADPSEEGDLPTGETCPTCGQVIGTKHRERVAALRAKLFAEAREKRQRVVSHNEEVRGKLGELRVEEERQRARRDEAERYNSSQRARVAQLEAKLGALNDTSIPDLPPEPIPPTEAYLEEEHRAVQAEIEDWKRRKSQWDLLSSQYASARSELAERGTKQAELQSMIQRYEIFEDALKDLPQRILAKQRAYLALDMPDYVVEVDDEVSIRHVDGRPYELLSTGEAVRAAFALSYKLNSLMRRPINMVFLDNADLVDNWNSLVVEPLQTFIAVVRPHILEAEVAVCSWADFTHASAPIDAPVF